MTASIRLDAPADLETLTREADFQALVVHALRLLGWVVIHVRQMQGNDIGVPDLLCFRGERGILLELKIGRRGLSPGQRRWQERWLPEGTVVHVIHNTAEDWDRLMRLVE